jgi:hypothetical protein
MVVSRLHFVVVVCIGVPRFEEAAYMGVLRLETVV